MMRSSGLGHVSPEDRSPGPSPGANTKSRSVELRAEGIDSPIVAALFAALSNEIRSRYPNEDGNFFRLDAAEVVEGKGALVVAYSESKPIGCGAVRCIDEHTAEIKRLYVQPAARGYSVGYAILRGLESKARRLGAVRVVLETGKRQQAALDLYQRCGYERIPAFGEYVGSELSVCMPKAIGG